MISPSQINLVNNKFWQEQGAALDRYLSDPVIVAHMLRGVRRDELMCVPPGLRQTIEELAEQAAAVQSGVVRHRAQHAASARRLDALQRLIEREVERDPCVRSKELLRRLEGSGAGRELALKVVGDQIQFRDRKRTHSARLSGFKDRVYRARRDLKLTTECASSRGVVSRR